MVQALNVEPEKILSKGVKSVRSRVTNIAEHLHEPMDIMTFRQSFD
jgi:lipoate-protein ligase A